MLVKVRGLADAQGVALKTDLATGIELPIDPDYLDAVSWPGVEADPESDGGFGLFYQEASGATWRERHSPKW
jgi:hypothetical protein